MVNVKKFKARKIVPGKATGPVLVSKERLGWLGFTDPKRGVFSSSQTELQGKSFNGVVLIYRSGKGATGGPRAVNRACRYGNRPAAAVNLEIDSVTVAGYALDDIPMVQAEDLGIFDQVRDGDIVTVDADNGEIVARMQVVRIIEEGK